MALPISSKVNTDIVAKPKVQFDDGKKYGYAVVDTALGLTFRLRKGINAVANGDLNVVLYELDDNGDVRQVALLLTEADLRRDFDGVPD